MTIHNFAEANAVLKAYIPAVKEVTGKDITLQRIKPLMEFLGNPENRLNVIHIAGTSGKTSTACYIAGLLQTTGKKIGLTISPHIDSVAERIQINMVPLREAEFCAELNTFLELIKYADPQPTYFELLVAFAYWYFDKEGVDYAVIETGLGGLHDATNVAQSSNKVCVITDIGFDHTMVLGNTLTKIATQKAGIIHQGNHVFCYQQRKSIMQVFNDVCNQKQATLHDIVPAELAQISLDLPLFQMRNWSLARVVYDFIVMRDQLQRASAETIIRSSAISIPGRMETIRYKNKTIIIDGAHNPQKIGALLGSIKHSYPHQDVAVLAGFVQSRRTRLYNNLRRLLQITNYLVITNFIPNQEMHTKSADPLKITDYCKELGFTNFTIEANHQKALQKLLNRPEPVLLVTGSFYLLHYIRPLIIAKHD